MITENEFRVVALVDEPQEAVDIQYIAKIAKLGIEIRSLDLVRRV